MQEVASLLSQTAGVAARAAEALLCGPLPAAVLPKLWPICTTVLASMLGAAWATEDGTLTDLGAGVCWCILMWGFFPLANESFFRLAWTDAVNGLTEYMNLPADERLVCHVVL